MAAPAPNSSAPGGRADALDPRCTHLGTVSATDLDGRTHLTQNFQLPR